MKDERPGKQGEQQRGKDEMTPRTKEVGPELQTAIGWRVWYQKYTTCASQPPLAIRTPFLPGPTTTRASLRLPNRMKVAGALQPRAAAAALSQH